APPPGLADLLEHSVQHVYLRRPRAEPAASTPFRLLSYRFRPARPDGGWVDKKGAGPAWRMSAAPTRPPCSALAVPAARQRCLAIGLRCWSALFWYADEPTVAGRRPA